MKKPNIFKRLILAFKAFFLVLFKGDVPVECFWKPLGAPAVVKTAFDVLEQSERMRRTPSGRIILRDETRTKVDR